MSGRFANRSCLVTGGGSGIGEAVCRRFAADGADVAVADISNTAAKRVADSLEESGSQALAIEMDVAEEAQVVDGVRRAEEAFGRLDILVTAAGISHIKSINEAPPEDFDRMFGVNVKGTWLAVRAAVPAFERAGGGKAILIASTSGARGWPDQSLYCASKGAIINLTRQLSLELCDRNINVNAIGPGVTNTPIFDKMGFSLSEPANLQACLDVIPAGRLAEPSEIAAAVAFLAADDSAYVHGQTLFVDGGYLSK